MWLTLLALRNRIGILMLSLAMVILGATSVQRMPVDLFPQIQVPVAFVGVIYKGAPPLDIEQSVVYPIEKAVSSASNVAESTRSGGGILRRPRWPLGKMRRRAPLHVDDPRRPRHHLRRRSAHHP